MKQISISKSDNGMRLDKFLFKIMTAPQGEVYRSLRKKKIKINGRRTTDGSVRLNTGDIIELYINDEFLSGINQEEITPLNIRTTMLYIAYEDDNIIVMNKPSGMLSQAEEGESLEGLMRDYLKNKNEYNAVSAYKPSLCHRIDRNTAGLVIGAKNISAHRIITEKIKLKEIRKFYICCVCGTLKAKRGTISGYITKVGNNKVRFDDNNTGDGKYSELEYRVLSEADNTSFIEAELKSGRTHQIRVSFAHIGNPLIGDVKYGAPYNGGRGFQNLTAYKLVFDFSKPAGELEYLGGKTIEIAR